MKKFLMACGTLLIASYALPAHAGETSGYTQVQSGYVVTSGVQVSNDWTLNASATHAFDNGVYIGAWGMLGIAENPEADEIDWYAGITSGKWDVSVGLYDFAPVKGFEEDVYTAAVAYSLSDNISIKAAIYHLPTEGLADGFGIGPDVSCLQGHLRGRYFGLPGRGKSEWRASWCCPCRHKLEVLGSHNNYMKSRFHERLFDFLTFIISIPSIDNMSNIIYNVSDVR